MKFKVLVPLFAAYLAVCHAASSSARKSGLEGALERLAAVKVELSLEDLKATVDVGSETLAKLASTSCRVSIEEATSPYAMNFWPQTTISE